MTYLKIMTIEKSRAQIKLPSQGYLSGTSVFGYFNGISVCPYAY